MQSRDFYNSRRHFKDIVNNYGATRGLLVACPKEAKMPTQLAWTIRMWVLLALQASLTTGEDKCSSTTYNYSSDGNSLNLMIKDIKTTQRECFCEMTTDPATVACSLYACLSSGPIDPSDIVCSLLPCPCAKIVNVTISPTCISTYTTSLNCLQGVMGSEARSCHSSTKSLLSFSAKRALSCSMEVKSKDLVFTIQHIKIDGDVDTSEQALKEGNCTSKPAKPNASSTSVTPTTLISSSVTTAAIIVKSTPKPETAGRPSPTLVSGSMIMSLTTEPLQKPRMIPYDSGKNIGIGVGVGGGILLIIAILIVTLFFRRRRAESNNFRADDRHSTQSSAAAPCETACESNTVLVSAAFENAFNDAMPGYQAIAYDNEPVGESNDGYNEETSNHNG